jgi:RNA polymerase sigma factor (sigma-70 family)
LLFHFEPRTTESPRLETGLTAGKLIRARLLLEAKRLLLYPELAIPKIGYELGVEGRSYFSRFVRRQLLEKALDRLPAKFREVLVLFEIERWSYKAIAAALKVRLVTVMSRLNRARRRLQQENHPSSRP